MTEEQLRAMTEEQIRARYAATPAYYLQAKLEKKRALDAGSASPARTRREIPALKVRPEPPARTRHREPASLDIALPGFEILDAALCEVEYAAPARFEDPCAEPTQHAILEAALEDYDSWPLMGEPELDVDREPETARDRASEHERTLELVLGAEAELDLLLEVEPDPDLSRESQPVLDLLLEAGPDLDVLLDSQPDLELVLESEPGLDPLLESEPQADATANPEPVPDNVTVGNFRPRSVRKVRVVSVAMDRKRPNMVRVIGESTRRAG
jgi:hypothetical protein